MNYEKKIETAFNEFDGKNLEVLEQFYDRKAVFSDPVKMVKGLDKIKTYYSHTYKNVQSIKFDFHNFVIKDHDVVGEWTMKLKAKALNGGKPFDVRGCSVFKFNDKGLVIEHHDYLDLGEMVYEKLPLFGKIILAIRKSM